MLNAEIYYNKVNNTTLEIWRECDWDFDTTQNLCKDYKLDEISETEFNGLIEKQDFCGFTLYNQNKDTIIEKWSIPSKYLFKILSAELLNSFDVYVDEKGNNLLNDYDWGIK